MTKDTLIITKVSNSSQVDTIWYMVELNRMRVKYKPSGAEYLYHNVSKEEYDSVLSAESVGKKLREVITGKSFRKFG